MRGPPRGARRRIVRTPGGKAGSSAHHPKQRSGAGGSRPRPGNGDGGSPAGWLTRGPPPLPARRDGRSFLSREQRRQGRAPGGAARGPGARRVGRVRRHRIGLVRRHPRHGLTGGGGVSSARALDRHNPPLRWSERATSGQGAAGCQSGGMTTTGVLARWVTV